MARRGRRRKSERELQSAGEPSIRPMSHSYSMGVRPKFPSPNGFTDIPMVWPDSWLLLDRKLRNCLSFVQYTTIVQFAGGATPLVAGALGGSSMMDSQPCHRGP